MSRKMKWAIALGVVVLVGLGWRTLANNNVFAAGTTKPMMIMRLYTGPDGMTHAEEFEAKFVPGKPADIYKMMKVNGAELHREAPGTVMDWHVGPRRQYVITLTGRAEIEVAGGKKIESGPGHIELIEDTTGKGHITRVIGNEERVTLQLPLEDQSGK